MLRWRLTLGVLIVAALVGLCWLDAHSAIPGLWLMPLALLIAVLGSQELIAMMRKRGLEPQAGIAYATNVAVVLANAFLTLSLKNIEHIFPEDFYYVLGYLHEGFLPLLVVAFGILASFVAAIRRYSGPGKNTEQLALTALAIAYIGILLTFVIQLRLGTNEYFGLLPLLSLVAVVKMCDIGAYTVGRLVGRHKMTPILSPGKTWEGAFGGVAFGCLASWIMLSFAGPHLVGPVATPLPRNAWIVYGILVSIAGSVGDLAESLLKRDLGCKDSSNWMPGFGGVLDILDSILFAAPVAYLCWKVYLVS